MLNWLIFGIPWEIQMTFLGALALATLCVVGRVFGWGVVRQVALPVLGVLAAVGLASRAQQKGYEARKVEEDQAEKRADEVVEKTRADVNALPETELNKETDRWSKP